MDVRVLSIADMAYELDLYTEVVPVAAGLAVDENPHRFRRGRIDNLNLTKGRQRLRDHTSGEQVERPSSDTTDRQSVDVDLPRLGPQHPCK
jgi:hypothetical protein